jgi:uncharacterized protein (TIGR02996 family)
MASVMVIVSKAVFEKSARGLELGDVWDTDEYASRHKALEALADGGDMFLVTVRPPEQLWLVAVLRDPRATDRGWKAKRPNAEPIRAIDPLRDKLRFVTGAGITAKAGALGMSLQTPRVLADSDVALLSGAAPATSAKSKPAAAPATSAKSKPAAAPATSAKSKPASIATAGAHASRGEWPQALAALLEDWRRSPRRAVADAIVAIDPALPELEVTSASWLATAKVREPATLHALLATIFDDGATPARTRAEALCEWPLDPRIDRWMAGLYERPVYTSTGARPLWTRLQPLTQRIVDAAAIETIQKARKGNWKQYSFTTDFLADYVDRAKLSVAAEQPLSSSDAGELAKLVLALGAATAKPSGGDAPELLARVLETPSDDSLRGVLADALVEAGDPRGELIALQLAPPTPERKRRAKQIIDESRKQLLGALAPVLTDATFEKGFVARAKLKAPTTPAIKNAIAACVGDPLWATVEQLEGPGDHEVTLHPVMRSLRSLADSGVPIAQLAKMSRLESLACLGVTKADVGVIVRGFPALRELSLELALYLGFSAPLATQLLSAAPLATLATLELAVEVSSYRNYDNMTEQERTQREQLSQLIALAAKSPIPAVTIRVMRHREKNWSSFCRLIKSTAGLEVGIGMTASPDNWEPLIEADMLVAIDAIERLRPNHVTLDKPPRVKAVRDRIEQRLAKG